MSKLTIFRGLPGSGKSMAAHDLAKSTGAFLIEPDMFCTHDGKYYYTERDYDRARRLAKEFVHRASMLGADIIYADVLPRCEDVNQIIGLLATNGYEVEIYSLSISKEVSIKRNRHKVDKFDIGRMAEAWDADYLGIAAAAGDDCRHIKEYCSTWKGDAQTGGFATTASTI